MKDEIENVVGRFLAKTRNNFIWEDQIVKLLIEERNKVLDEVKREVEKKYESDFNMENEPYILQNEYNKGLDDISTIIDQLKLK